MSRGSGSVGKQGPLKPVGWCATGKTATSLCLVELEC